MLRNSRMTTGSTGSLFPKWQLAGKLQIPRQCNVFHTIRWIFSVLLGAPIAIGLGYLYYRNQSTDLHDGDEKKKKIADLKGQTISLDGDDKLTPEHHDETPILTPLEQATASKNDGNVCFRKGKYDEAIVHYDKVWIQWRLPSEIQLLFFIRLSTNVLLAAPLIYLPSTKIEQPPMNNWKNGQPFEMIVPKHWNLIHAT